MVTKFLDGVDWGKLKRDLSLLKQRTGCTHDVKLAAFRNDKNVKSFLVRTRVGVKKEKKGKRMSCGRKNCSICRDGGSLETADLPFGGEIIQLKKNLGCKEENVVHFLFCRNWQQGYVGATSRELSKRFGEHLGKIKIVLAEVQTVHLHFKQKKGCKHEIGILEKVEGDRLFETEKWFIKKMKPYFNVQDAVYMKTDAGYVMKKD